MVKGVEKGYILEIENSVKFNVHSPLKRSFKISPNQMSLTLQFKLKKSFLQK